MGCTASKPTADAVCVASNQPVGAEKTQAQPQPDPAKLPAVDVPPPVADHSYTDWSRTMTFTPQLVQAPTSTEELYNFLSTTTGPVSIVGSGHSCSGNYASKTVITLDKMPCEIRDISGTGDHPFSRVVISANMPLRQVLVELGKNRRALPATGGTDEQQFGGIIATNTAPATKERTIYSGIEEIKYTTADKKDNVAKGEDLKAFICNLGILGVVTSVVCKTIPDEGYRVIQRIQKVDALIDLMSKGKNFVNDESDDNADPYPFWRFDWVPDRDFALLWAARDVNTVSDPAYLANGDYVKDYKQPMDMNLYNFIASISSDNPFLNKNVSAAFDVMAKTIEKQTTQNTFYGPLRNMIPVDRFCNENVNCTMAEWAFHPKQIKQVYGLYKAYFETTEWPNLPIEIEYVMSDNYYMSPWNAEDIVVDGERTDFLCKINMMWYSLKKDKEDPEFREKIVAHAKGIWDILKENKISFKAHWGKINFTSPGDVEKLYNFKAFEPLIQHQFINSYIKRRLPIEEKQGGV